MELKQRNAEYGKVDGGALNSHPSLSTYVRNSLDTLDEHPLLEICHFYIFVINLISLDH